MANKYFKYVPLTRMINGAEYVHEFVYGKCSVSESDLTLKDILTDPKGQWHYVIMSSDSEELLTTVMDAISGRFSAVELKEIEFLGECCWLYKPVAIDDETPPTFKELMQQYGLDYTQSDLELKKIGRVNMLKCITKRKFDKWNDVTADITKIITLLFGHYDSLSADDKSTVDGIVNRAKAIYNAQMCMDAFESMVSGLEAKLAPYYSKKVQIESAADDDELAQIVLE